MQGEDSLKEQDLSRRKLLQVMGAATFCASFPANVVPESVSRDRDASEKSRIPKIALELSRTGSYFATGTVDEAGMRRLKQLGVNDVLMGGPPIPWLEPDLRALIDKLKAGGLELGNMMITGFPNTVYGKPGRDEEIEKIQQSIRAAGRVGLPAFDYDRVKDLPPLAEEGAHKLEEMWSNITYFLRAVIPIAEESGVRLALHPNDPPAPLSRGSQQIMGSVEGWKRLISIVPSKSNGITFDCGVTREMGQDPVEVCRYFGSKDVINHVHYRNVRVQTPNEKYTEVFIDEGVNDMYAVMKELVRQKYSRLIYPEHPRALDYDGERPDFKPYYPGGGGYAAYAYNVGYTRAMIQASLAS